jgi:hypothetical protein
VVEKFLNPYPFQKNTLFDNPALPFDLENINPDSGSDKKLDNK